MKEETVKRTHYDVLAISDEGRVLYRHQFGHEPSAKEIGQATWHVAHACQSRGVNFRVVLSRTLATVEPPTEGVIIRFID